MYTAETLQLQAQIPRLSISAAQYPLLPAHLLPLLEASFYGSIFPLELACWGCFPGGFIHGIHPHYVIYSCFCELPVFSGILWHFNLRPQAFTPLSLSFNLKRALPLSSPSLPVLSDSALTSFHTSPSPKLFPVFRAEAQEFCRCIHRPGHSILTVTKSGVSG